MSDSERRTRVVGQKTVDTFGVKRVTTKKPSCSLFAKHSHLNFYAMLLIKPSAKGGEETGPKQTVAEVKPFSFD